MDEPIDQTGMPTRQSTVTGEILNSYYAYLIGGNVHEPSIRPIDKAFPQLAAGGLEPPADQPFIQLGEERYSPSPNRMGCFSSKASVTDARKNRGQGDTASNQTEALEEAISNWDWGGGQTRNNDHRREQNADNTSNHTEALGEAIDEWNWDRHGEANQSENAIRRAKKKKKDRRSVDTDALGDIIDNYDWGDSGGGDGGDYGGDAGNGGGDGSGDGGDGGGGD